MVMEVSIVTVFSMETQQHDRHADYEAVLYNFLISSWKQNLLSR